MTTTTNPTSGARAQVSAALAQTIGDAIRAKSNPRFVGQEPTALHQVAADSVAAWLTERDEALVNALKNEVTHLSGVVSDADLHVLEVVGDALVHTARAVLGVAPDQPDDDVHP